MVCLGNICRSPIAEGVIKALLSQKNIKNWVIDSAAIGNWHIGELPDSRAIQTASEHGIDITDQKARQIDQKDFDYFDHILVMDTEIQKSAYRLASSQEQKRKISLLLEFKYPGENRIVPDPYFDNSFECAYQLILEGCESFLEKFND